jgi:DNA-binding GntR family transcriptional regulator
MTTHTTISTEELAALFGVRPQTVRHALCRHGSYFGLRPRKLPNRLLQWDLAAAEAVRRGERPAAADANRGEVAR